jgi:hypothetical protein
MSFLIDMNTLTATTYFNIDSAKSSGHVASEASDSTRPSSIESSIMSAIRMESACFPNNACTDSPPTEAERIYAHLTVLANTTLESTLGSGLAK